MAGNIFSEALQLLDKQAAGHELTEEEQVTCTAAMIPLDRIYSDIPIKEALRKLAVLSESPPDDPGLKFWHAGGDLDVFPLTQVFRGGGYIAQLVRYPSGSHTCRKCGAGIDQGEPHYMVYLGGAGFRNIKFPGRVHVACLPGHLGTDISAAAMKEMWGALFDYARAHITEMERKRQMAGFVTCMQRVWGEIRRLRNGSTAE